MAQPTLSHFVQFLHDELHVLCSNKATGTLLVVTSRGQVVQFGLKDGEIVAVIFQSAHGLDALQSLEALRYQTIRAGTSRFTEGHLPLHKAASLPPTPQILNLLLDRSRQRTTVSEPSSLRMSNRTHAIVEQELVEFIGPMAVIVCDEVWQATSSLEAALDALCLELPPAQVQRFRQNVMRRLG